PLLAAVKGEGERLLVQQEALVRRELATLSGQFVPVLEAVRGQGAEVRGQLATLSDQLAPVAGLPDQLATLSDQFNPVLEAVRGQGAALLEPLLAALRTQGEALAERQARTLHEILDAVAVRGGDGEVALEPLLAAVKGEGERLLVQQEALVRRELAGLRETEEIPSRRAAAPAPAATDPAPSRPAGRHQPWRIQGNALSALLVDLSRFVSVFFPHDDRRIVTRIDAVVERLQNGTPTNDPETIDRILELTDHLSQLPLAQHEYEGDDRILQELDQGLIRVAQGLQGLIADVTTTSAPVASPPPAAASTSAPASPTAAPTREPSPTTTAPVSTMPPNLTQAVAEVSVSPPPAGEEAEPAATRARAPTRENPLAAEKPFSITGASLPALLDDLSRFVATFFGADDGQICATIAAITRRLRDGVTISAPEMVDLLLQLLDRCGQRVTDRPIDRSILRAFDLGLMKIADMVQTHVHGLRTTPPAAPTPTPPPAVATDSNINTQETKPGTATETPARTRRVRRQHVATRPPPNVVGPMPVATTATDPRSRQTPPATPGTVIRPTPAEKTGALPWREAVMRGTGEIGSGLPRRNARADASPPGDAVGGKTAADFPWQRLFALSRPDPAVPPPGGGSVATPASGARTRLSIWPWRGTRADDDGQRQDTPAHDARIATVRLPRASEQAAFFNSFLTRSK
ncbi:MAG: hypothetical protein HQL66_12095, partial [Magnetococcales bacterium]|nr:hypothetical protein [Magnetococcales bacterium]